MNWILKCFTGLVILATTRSTYVNDALFKLRRYSALNQDQLSEMYLMTERRQVFTIRFLQNAVADSPQKSLLFSPYSVYMSFLLLSLLNASPRRKQLKMKNLLNLSVEKDISSLIHLFRLEKQLNNLKTIDSHSNYTVSNMNRLFVSFNQPIDKFMEPLIKYDVEKINFHGYPNLAIKYINTWGNVHTGGLIDNLVSELEIKEDTMLVMASMGYFKAKWTSKFYPNLTTKREFYKSPTESVFVIMMQQIGKFNFLHLYELDAYAIELPYNGDEYSMYIMLPMFIEQRGISEIIEELNEDFFQNLVMSSDWKIENVNVSIPKFNMEQSSEKLEKILFEKEDNDSFFVHKASFFVDEEGGDVEENLQIMMDNALNNVIEFNCDHPFLYFIFNKKSGRINLIGTYHSHI